MPLGVPVDPEVGVSQGESPASPENPYSVGTRDPGSCTLVVIRTTLPALGRCHVRTHILQLSKQEWLSVAALAVLTWFRSSCFVHPPVASTAEAVPYPLGERPAQRPVDQTNQVVLFKMREFRPPDLPVKKDLPNSPRSRGWGTGTKKLLYLEKTSYHNFRVLSRHKYAQHKQKTSRNGL